ncbi:MAG TPA: hypothetical protein DCE43_19320 [Planctomycetaceae bacterium]|nr:hypothetical protein [Planctomycetaceae bacterium]HCK54757.1 hypothetical protein [Planctomycetaceae bacterium]
MANEPTMTKSTDSRPTRDQRRWPLWKKLLVAITVLMVSFGVAETIATAFYLRGDIEPQSIWVHATDNQTAAVSFDPVLGYRLTANPTRMMIIGSNGVIESSGTFRGNNLGAPDNDDFFPARGPDNRKRFVVLGDSFTSGLYMERSWPDIAESLSQQGNSPIELLNFSIDGGGVANWQQVLTRIIVADGYDIDGVIFAVYGTDLSRPFTFWDQVVPGYNRPMQLGRWPDFQASGPETRSRDRLEPLDTWQVVSSQVFDQYLSGQRRPPVSRPFQFYLTGKCRALVSSLFHHDDESRQLLKSLSHLPDAELFFRDRRHVISEIEDALQKQRLPALVVHIPYREVLLTRAGVASENLRFYLESVGESWETQSFAKLIGADFVDGSEAFKDLSVAEIHAHWLPIDGHWNQAGAEQFAKFLVPIVKTWADRQK